jgi:hypothetical protein
MQQLPRCIKVFDVGSQQFARTHAKTAKPMRERTCAAADWKLLCGGAHSSSS